MSAGIGAPDVTGTVGRLASIGRSGRRGPHVVVGTTGGEYTLLRSDGSEHQVRAARVALVEQPDFPGVRSLCGELLAASERAEGEVRRQLLDRSVARASSDVRLARSLAEDAIRLDSASLISALPLTDTERSWWAALSHWTMGRRSEAVTEFLSLPVGAYRNRLPYLVASAELLGSSHSERLAEVLAGFGTGAEALVASLVSPSTAPSPSTANGLVQSAAAQSRLRLENAQVGSLLTGAVGELPSERLLGALHHGRSRLGADGGLVDLASIEIVDELIDRGHVPDAWVSTNTYVQARIDISVLPADEVARQGGELELARRHIIENGSLPAAATPEARSHFAPLLAVLEGDLDAAASLVEGTDIPADELAAAFGDDRLLPSESVLADPSLAAFLSSKVHPDVAESASLGPAQRRFVANLKLRDARASIRRWSFEEALQQAKECLRFSEIEKQRDEALNLLGFCKWQLGEHAAAIDALRTALEGDYTEALLSNIAVVAAAIDPETAALHLSRLVAEAPSLEMRIAAARQALSLWGQSDEPWATDDDLPATIASALRGVVVEDIDEETFVEFAQLLAAHDEEWMANKKSLRGSPHADSQAARVWQARARGIDEFIKELASLMSADSPAWATRQRDLMVDAVLSVIVDPEPPFGAVAMGMEMLDARLPMESSDRAVIGAFAARGAAMAIDPEEGEPAEKFVVWLEDAAKEVSRAAPEHRERAEAAVSLGFTSLAFAYYQARFRMLQQAAEMHDMVAAQLRFTPRYRINHAALREATSPAMELINDTLQLVGRLLPHVDGDARDALSELEDHTRTLQRAFQQLTR